MNSFYLDIGGQQPTERHEPIHRTDLRTSRGAKNQDAGKIL